MLHGAGLPLRIGDGSMPGRAHSFLPQEEDFRHRIDRMVMFPACRDREA